MTQRLALFIPSMRGGGAERVTLILAREFAKRGYPVDLLLAQAEGPYLAAIPKSVRVVDFKVSRVLFSLAPLVRYLRREQPKAMLSMMAYTNIVALWARRLARVSTRAIVSERVTISWRLQQTTNQRHWASLPWMIKRFYPWADGIIAVANGVTDDLVQMASLPREQIQTIYNPIVRPELQELAQAPLDHPWFKPDSPPVVLAAGRLTAQKDYPTLIRAFARARQDQPMRLLILGEGPDRAGLEALIKELNLEEDVSLPGFVENPYAYMARAPVFVLSSRWEGLPGVLIEALYCGASLIATDCPGGSREILQDGQHGQLVSMGNIEAMAQAINAALAGQTPRPSGESWRPFEQERVVDDYIRLLLGNESTKVENKVDTVKMREHVQANFDNLASMYRTIQYERPTTIRSFEKIRRMELLVDYAQSLEPESVLDAGCGPGIVLATLRRRLPEARFAGVDLSYRMLEQAQANNVGAIAFIQSLVEQLPLADESFDLIYALGVIDYLEDPPAFFETVQRLLKPNGHFIFTYPNQESINRTLLISLRSYKRGSQQNGDSIPIKTGTIDRLITDYGFVLLDRHFITYGNGLIAFPWSVTASRKIELWCHQKPIRRYLGWSGLCLVRKIVV